MRILHVSTRLILGGSQENTVLSCEGQALRGHEVHLAFGPIYGPEGSLLERVESFSRKHPQAPIRTHVVENLVREVSPLKDAKGLRELEALIDRIEPHIVHTHSSKAGILGRLAGWNVLRRRAGAGKPRTPGVVHTIHGPPFMPIEGGPLRRVKIRASNGAYTLAERLAAGRCHAIVSVADAMTRQFLERGIGQPEIYKTVYSGMETRAFLEPAPGEDRDAVRASLGFDRGDFVVGTVARLAQHKGHDDLLEALGGELRQRKNWKLLWVGDGWWRERLIARARTLGLGVVIASGDDAKRGTGDASIVLTGLVPPERVASLIRAMDVLAHPSAREGLPRTVPQALLTGVCPVAYDVDGTGEACRDMETGRLVRLGDRAALREAICWLFENPGARERLAAEGRRWCAERFDASHMVESLDEMYRVAIARAGDAGGRG
ncbi:MAG: glycosyltransferase [Planctomycetota bacterium]|nr:glycosyltransferase [Planctomycetota bacterium]